VILSEGGLKPALRAVASRSAVPADLQVRIDDRLEEGIEAAAYYVVAEALTNTAKHADASVAGVNVEARDGILDLVIDDDGVGGADPADGSGLLGLSDRVEALGGNLRARRASRRHSGHLAVSAALTRARQPACLL
jgi:signal transduction histidine kinase